MRRLADQSGWVPVLGIMLLCLFAMLASGLGWSVYQVIDGGSEPSARTATGGPEYVDEVWRDNPRGVIIGSANGRRLPIPNRSSFAIEAWVRWDEGDDWGTVTAAGSWYYGRVAILARADGDKHLVNLYFDGKVVARGGAELGGDWHHLVANYGNGRAQLFVDGRSIATAPAKKPNGRSAQLNIGRSLGDDVPRYVWPGAIKDVALYGAPLKPKRIRVHLASGQQ